jgi:hypothetical protein
LQAANAHLNLPTTRQLAPERAALLDMTAADPARTIAASRKLAQDDVTVVIDTESAAVPASDPTDALKFKAIRFKAMYQLEKADPDFATQLQVCRLCSQNTLSPLLYAMFTCEVRSCT